MINVLITGITGFLGSHIAEHLCNNNINVIGLKRKKSDTWRCKDFETKIKWVDLDLNGDWRNILVKLKPDTIIHSAWIGVEADYRNDWERQNENISFLIALLSISKDVKLKKFIFLGSQAEYGTFNGKVTEEKLVKANNAYASIKLACFEILRTFSEINKIDWIWLRIFSLFGEREGYNWLIPSIINKMQRDSSMDFTLGEQSYAYLYVKDFAKIIYLTLIKQLDSGIYNVSATMSIQLKVLIELIRDQVNPKFKLNFGVLPYREHQSMHIEGDTTKLFNRIGPIEFTDFNVALLNTINYYRTN